MVTVTFKIDPKVNRSQNSSGNNPAHIQIFDFTSGPVRSTLERFGFFGKVPKRNCFLSLADAINFAMQGSTEDNRSPSNSLSGDSETNPVEFQVKPRESSDIVVMHI